jgi:dolichol-phosphate mannosyltransferase
MISIILPTYNEAENLELIVFRLSQVMHGLNLPWEVLVVDDNSPDGTFKIAQKLEDKYPLRAILRIQDRGLSAAVIEGFKKANGEICVVMDADLSHPPESIAELIFPIQQGYADISVGSRYILSGGSNDWPIFRVLCSRVAGFFAKGITSLKDPTSGFMAVRRDLVSGLKLDPVGWKIVLEVVAKSKPKARIIEVPFIFADRVKGKSKLSFFVQMQYVLHLFRLYVFRLSAIKSQPVTLSSCLVEDKA